MTLRNLKAYLELFRLPNLFTAVADVSVGYLFVYQSLSPTAVYLALLLASCLLYTAGMVLNDVYDLKKDALERPQRPLPSQRISVSWATWIGYWMLLMGVAFAGSSGFLYPSLTAFPWRGTVVGSLLAICIVGYDRCLKQTVTGPVIMGACRMLNLLLGMSAADLAAVNVDNPLLGFKAAQLTAAMGLGIYVAGVTWLARNEAGESHRWALVMATTILLAGIFVMSTFPQFFNHPSLEIMDRGQKLPYFLLFIAAVPAGRCLRAIITPRPSIVQAAVKSCLMTLIFLDAAICFVIVGSVGAVGILVLLLPAMTLGKWIYST